MFIYFYFILFYLLLCVWAPRRSVRGELMVTCLLVLIWKLHLRFAFDEAVKHHPGGVEETPRQQKEYKVPIQLT